MRATNTTGEANCTCRYGYVSDYDEQRHMARVRFPDMGDLISGWLCVGVMNSLKNHDEFALDIDEHVFCVLNGNGIEEGIILASIYDDKNKPENKNREQRYIKFSDGTEIYYDRENHELLAKNNSGSYIRMKDGEIEIHGENHVNITAPRIDLN